MSSRVSVLPRPQYLLPYINRFLVLKSCLVFTRLSSLLACLVRVLLCLVGACKIWVSTCCELCVLLICSCVWSDWHVYVWYYCCSAFVVSKKKQIAINSRRDDSITRSINQCLPQRAPSADIYQMPSFTSPVMISAYVHPKEG